MNMKLNLIYLPVIIELYKSRIEEINREPIMTRRIATAAMLTLVSSNSLVELGAVKTGVFKDSRAIYIVEFLTLDNRD